MCTTIRFNDGSDVETVNQFQERFKVDAKLYGWDGRGSSLDCCLCAIELGVFFNDYPQLGFEYSGGDWWEKGTENSVTE